MDELCLEPDLWIPRTSPLDPIIQDARRFYGLPDDSPVVVTGHQPVPPHPGILTKYIAAEAWASLHDALTVHLVIDTGLEPVACLDVPIGEPPAGIEVFMHTLADESSGPLMCRMPATPRSIAQVSSPASVVAGVSRLVQAWQQAPREDAAAQAWSVVQDVMSPWVVKAPVIFASQLIESPVGALWVEAMRSDACGCVDAYNRAARAFPEARIALLAPGDDPELPLWVIDGTNRRPAYASDLSEQHRLVPRALLTTAIVRSMVDLFVHGSGGMRYEQVMEAWLALWRPTLLAPKVLATASCRLPLGDPSDFALARQHALAANRQAQHDPDARGSGLSASKQRLLEEVGRHDRGTPGRQAAYEALQAYVQDRRKAHQGSTIDLEAIDRSTGIAARRDWPAVFYDLTVMDHLAQAIRDCFSAVSTPHLSKSVQPSHRPQCQ